MTESNGYVLISINIEENKMSARVFARENAIEAEQAYLEEEKLASPEKEIIAMVATPNIGELKAAYPNYFADSTQFLERLLCIISSFKLLRAQIHSLPILGV